MEDEMQNVLIKPEPVWLVDHRDMYEDEENIQVKIETEDCTISEHSTQMEWTDEKCLLLVELYRRKPCLWKSTSSSLSKKNDAWNEIASAMNCTIVEVKDKMNSLQATFQRELQNASGTSSERVQRSSWFAFRHMRFLKDKVNLTESQMTSNYRRYENGDLFTAANKVRDGGYSIYKAAKECNVPWSTLKGFLSRTKDEDDVSQCLPKLGKPFALSTELEQRIFKYVTTMQEMGFGLTVIQIRKLAYKLANMSGKKHPFNGEQAAGEWWWKDFKNRYGLSLRVPGNIASYRVVIDDFYKSLEQLLMKLQIKDCPHLIWNCDKTGLSYVVKSSKVVTTISKKYVYKRTYPDRGENHTMLLSCVNASGHWVPPMVIFKGVQMTDELQKDIIPGSIVKLSPKGWINSDLFSVWFRHFIKSISPSRPVVLLMDSHTLHVTEDVISLAKQNSIFLFTFPPHTTHLLQPLDVGVYRPFKHAWGKSLRKHMLRNSGRKPNRTDFHRLMKPAYLSAFNPETITSSFRKTGIYPLSPDVIKDEAFSKSKMTDKPKELSKAVENVGSLFVLPTIASGNTTEKGRKRDFTVKCLNPPSEEQTAKRSKGRPKNQNKYCTAASTSENLKADCGVCGHNYNEDIQKKTGAQWVQCSFCLVWYHNKCQNWCTIEDVFVCDGCVSDSDED